MITLGNSKHRRFPGSQSRPPPLGSVENRGVTRSTPMLPEVELGKVIRHYYTHRDTRTMSPRKPPLYSVHEAQEASFTEFGGWTMPVEFDSIKTEHHAVRTTVGIFDVSHMGEIEVTGPDALELTNRLTTNDVSALSPGSGQYSAITNEPGVILDDTIVYARDDGTYLFIPNAGHDQEMHDRWCTYRDSWGLTATVRNKTTEYAMFAVQGPDATDAVNAIVGDTVSDLSRFQTIDTSIADVPVIVSRTGYTGEDGFEILLPWDQASVVWSEFDCQPCGLGARDTLRLEAAFLLSGQDFHPDGNPRTPFEARIGFTVALDTEFVGSDALREQSETGTEESFVGFTLLERGIPRHGYEITNEEGSTIGTVTSGTMSPTLDTPIGLGYVPNEYADPGTAIHIVIRNSPKNAQITETPFINI